MLCSHIERKTHPRSHAGTEEMTRLILDSTHGKKANLKKEVMKKKGESRASAMPEQNIYMVNCTALEKSMSDFWDSSTA